MQFAVADHNGKYTGEYVEIEPVCAVHFCDSCGDCLHCYGDGYCPDGYHNAVVYQKEDGTLDLPGKE